MANFGIGLGAFMSGAQQGAQFANGIKDQQRKDKLFDLQLQDATDARNAQQGAKAVAQQGMTDARSATDGQIDNVMNYYKQNTVPKLQQYWMENGDMEKADRFGKWIEDDNTKQGMKYGAAMLRSAQLGDADGVADNMVKLYNQPGYFQDGLSADSATIIRDDKGNATGMKVVLKNDKTGETTDHTFNNMNDVYDMATQFAAPDKVFSHIEQQRAQADKIKISNAQQQQKWDQTVAGKKIDQNFRLEAQNNQSQLRQAENAAKTKAGGSNSESAKIQARIGAFKAAGKTDDWINANMTQIVGIENKSRPVTSRMDDYIKLQSETNRSFAKLSQDDQMKQALKYITEQDKMTGDMQNGTTGLPAATTPTTSGSNQGGTPYFDTKTGQIIMR